MSRHRIYFQWVLLTAKFYSQTHIHWHKGHVTMINLFKVSNSGKEEARGTAAVVMMWLEGLQISYFQGPVT